MQLFEGLGAEVVLSHLVDKLAVVPEERAEESVAQSHGAPDDRVEDRLDVSRGAADHPQDLSCRRLLLEGFGNLSMRFCKGEVLFLQLREQSHILDGDYGLVGKGLEEGDLLSRERAHLEPPDRDYADNGVLAHERDDEHGAEAAALLQHSCFEIIAAGEFVENVVDVNRPTLHNGASGRRGPRHGTYVAHRRDGTEMRR